MSLPGNGKMTPNGDQIHSRSPGNGTKMAVRSIDHANITKGDRVFAGLQLILELKKNSNLRGAGIQKTQRI